MKIKVEASKAMVKTIPLTTTLALLLKNKHCNKAPAIIITKARDIFAALSTIEAEAKDKLKAKDPLDLTFSLEDVAAVTKDAVNQKNVLQNMLQSVATV